MTIESKINVLMVEDNPYDARLIKEVLKELEFKHSIHTVTTGKNALNYLNQLKEHKELFVPDLVLLDLILPDISGMDLLKYIKKDSNLKNISVVIFTTSSEQENIDQAYQNQVNAYITKPFNYEGYLNVLRSLITYLNFNLN